MGYSSDIFMRRLFDSPERLDLTEPISVDYQKSFLVFFYGSKIVELSHHQHENDSNIDQE